MAWHPSWPNNIFVASANGHINCVHFEDDLEVCPIHYVASILGVGSHGSKEPPELCGCQGDGTCYLSQGQRIRNPDRSELWLQRIRFRITLQRSANFVSLPVASILTRKLDLKEMDRLTAPPAERFGGTRVQLDRLSLDNWRAIPVRAHPRPLGVEYIGDHNLCIAFFSKFE